MAKEIRWSVRADKERLEILDYWIKRNKSATYSIKLARLFKEKTDKLSAHPEVGIPTNHLSIKIKIVESYLIYYQIDIDHIKNLTVWDSRRNPKNFKL